MYVSVSFSVYVWERISLAHNLHVYILVMIMCMCLFMPSVIYACMYVWGKLHCVHVDTCRTPQGHDDRYRESCVVPPPCRKGRHTHPWPLDGAAFALLGCLG